MATLIRGIGKLLTLEGAWQKAGRRISEADLGIIPKAAILIHQGKILWVGPEKFLRSALKSLPASIKKITKEYDAQGRTVLPGWIDCHTHSVFAGNRWQEFEMRCQGATYQEIAQKGGGILSTMRATRTESKKNLFEVSQKRINEFLRQGVTTVEVKSGYALDLKGEVKQLEVARSLRGPRIITTFLGAHAKPPEFSTALEYLEFLTQNVLAKIKKKKLADRVDIFIEKNFFEGSSAKTYLEKARDLGFSLTVHADQLSLSGGSRTAVDLHAHSADHVIQIGPEEIQLFAKSETTAVLLPMADLYMKCDYPPARKLIDAGARVALATDFNPGSCPSQDIQLVGLLARLHMQMSLPEIIAAWTVGGAHALGLDDVGCLRKGFSADLQIIETDWQGLFYQAGKNPTMEVFVRGLRAKQN
ncbi:MAG: hypothetical protein RJB66_1216 [Pseudomonadota bacterium]